MYTVRMCCAALVIVLLAATCARSIDERAAFIFQKSAQNIGQLHSIQFAARIRTKVFDAAGAEKQFDNSLVFTYANGRVRSDARFTDRTSGERLHWLSLFDGARYRLFDETAGQLVLSNSSTLPYSTLLDSPLELPYSFLSKDAPATLAKMRDPSTWHEMSKYATYIGSESVDGRIYEKVKVAMPASPKLEANFLVYFDRQLNYFPMKSLVMLGDEKVFGRIEVRRHEISHLMGVECVIPMEVLRAKYGAEQRDFATNETVVSIEPSSLKLGVDFDDDLFTMATSRAEWVHDVDADAHLHVGGKVASISQDRRQQWRAIVASLCVAVVAMVVAWRIWKRRGARRNA